ncbi:MAG: VCBS repeat-containing protein [Phycisphaerales bacterium]
MSSLRAGAVVAVFMFVGGSAFGQFVEGDVEIIHELVGVDAGDSFGANVCAVADYNHDGAMEFLVAAPGVDDGGNNAGVVHLYDGATGTVIRSHYGTRANEAAGYVCDAGDVNADGIIDYLFGTDDAHVYVFSGADGAQLLDIVGTANTGFGFRACGVGDVTGDGHGDVLVGAWGNDAIGVNFGRAFLYSGADGSLVRTHDGPASNNARFGHTVSLIGDVDGDEVGDYSVGAPGPWGATFRGQVRVYSGATGLEIYRIDALSTGWVLAGWQQCQGFQNFNNDGVPDFVMCDIGDNELGPESGRYYQVDGATGNIIGSYHGFSINSGFGGIPWTPAGNIGDVTGDCISDALVASWRSQAGATEGGQAHLIDGSDGTVLRTFTSNRAGAYLAGTLSGAGDANGDGIGDYILAANGDSATRGAVYVVAGRDHKIPNPADLAADGMLNFSDVVEFLVRFASADPSVDYSGDGGFDFTDVILFLTYFAGEVCG